MISPKLTVFVLLSAICSALSAQPVITGAWQNDGKQQGKEITRILLLSGNHFSWTEHERSTGAFMKTKGGSWQLKEDQLTLNYEFDTRDTAMVGKTENWTVSVQDGRLSMQNQGGLVSWTNTDKGLTTPLTGAWLMAGRERDGEISRRDTNVPRKTMKILTGGRFQWIAYNTQTKEFFGTGGGEYTAKDGVYTEKIRFFSRDNKRVGMNLEFKFDIQEGEWHHMGKSSAGEPMHEIWVKRE